MTYEDFEEQTVEAFLPIQEVFKEKYNLDDYDRWLYNEATSLLTLSNDEEEINFNYIPLDIFSNNTQTWMWT